MPTTDTTTNTNPSVLEWMQFAFNVAESQKKGDFKLPPMDPQQQQMLTWAMQKLQSTPSTNQFLPILQHDLANTGSIDVDALKRGDTGYKPSSHMNAQQLASIISGNPSSQGLGTGPTPGQPGEAGGAYTGYPFAGSAGGGGPIAQAGSSGDPFGNWPGPSPNAKNVTLDDLKKYGPQAFKYASQLAGMGVGITEIVRAISWLYDKATNKGQDQTLPTKDAGKFDLTPAGYKPSPQREKYEVPYGDRAAAESNRQAGNRLASDPGQFAPERLGGGEGFGYGLDYDSFYGAGAGAGGGIEGGKRGKFLP